MLRVPRGSARTFCTATQLKGSLWNARWEASFRDCLPGDPEAANYVRQVKGACHSPCIPQASPSPRLVALSEEVCALLGVDPLLCRDEASVAALGGELPEGMASWAACYGGHQFGNFAGTSARPPFLTRPCAQPMRMVLQLPIVMGRQRFPSSTAPEPIC